MLWSKGVGDVEKKECSKRHGRWKVDVEFGVARDKHEVRAPSVAADGISKWRLNPGITSDLLDRM